MIPVFRVDRPLIAAILLALAAGAAVAQEFATVEGAPLPLVPEGAPAGLEPPPPGMPGEFAPGEEGSPSDIEIGELAAPDPDSGGMLEASMGGLGIDMWQGTERPLLQALLPQLPARFESRVLHDLARRLLLSVAIAPPRAADGSDASLMTMRIERLEAMGLTGAVADMLGAAAAPEDHPELLRILVDTRLLLGDTGRACDAATGGEGVLARGYRDRVLLFCQVLAGDTEAAGFSASILREADDPPDAAFFTLADALIGGTGPKLNSLPAPDPLLLAMAAAAGAKLPSDVLQTESLSILRALADSPAASPALQLAAAERAADAGAIAARFVAERYAAIEFSEKELAKALSIAKSDPSPRNRALLYQAVALQALPVAQAAAMQEAWLLAESGALPNIGVAVYLPVLEAMQPGGELAWFATDAARALFAQSRESRAVVWAAAATRLAEEPQAEAKAALLWPMVALSEGSATGAGHDGWLRALDATAGPDAGMRAGLAYSLFEAMGERIGESRWRALLQGVTRANSLSANPAYLRAFRAAAAAGRRGETVLLGLLLLGGGSLGANGPELVSEVVVGLRRVGLEAESRGLAIEAALAGGL